MATKKRSSKTRSLNATLSKPFAHPQVTALTLLFSAVFTTLALASFQGMDVTIYSAHKSGAFRAQNLAGVLGSNLAATLLQMFGVASLFFVVALVHGGWKIHKNESRKNMLVLSFWYFLAALSTAHLAAIYYPLASYGGVTLPTGGVFAAAYTKFLLRYLNPAGATLVGLLTLLTSLLCISPDVVSKVSQWLMDQAHRATVAFLNSLQVLRSSLNQTLAASAEKISLPEIKLKAPILPAKVAKTEVRELLEKSAKEIPEDVELTEDEVSPPAFTHQQMVQGILIDESFENARTAKPAKEMAMKPANSSRKKHSFAGVSSESTGEWKLPQLDFLKQPVVQDRELNREALLQNSKNLEAKLAEFGIKGQVVAVRPGPVITMYEFKPGAGVKISQIASRADDLSLALEAQSVRIVAPIPGKSVVGIELPNDFRDTVYLRELIATEEFQGSQNAIPIVVGKDIAGAPVITDIASTPHLLIAGSSGAGKSVFINTLITSLLYKFTPQDLRVIMVDPKQLELALYERIPHLLLPVVDDPQKASNALRWACQEMERRYTLMARSGVRNLKGFNEKLAADGLEKMRGLLCPLNDDGTPKASNIAHLLDHDEAGQPKIEHLPYILVIIDEFADLMMVARKEIESHVARLAAKARASGIHLIIATQRPSTDVITGVIKNNLPSRVAFKVPSQIDSRTILDGMGAEKLLGRGDMLFIPPGMSRLLRVHGAYIDEEEISRICDHWRAQGEPVYKEEIIEDPEVLEAGDGFDGEDDALYSQALTIIREENLASASRLQRRLKIGYNRAARLIETMEAKGIVGPGSGSKPREVLM